MQFAPMSKGPSTLSLIEIIEPPYLMAHTHENGTLANGEELPSATTREIAQEEEELKVDSERDVQRQLQQQHVAETEEKVAESVNEATEKMLTPKGLDVEAKLAPALTVLGNAAEELINSIVADIEVVKEELHHHRPTSNEGT